MFFLRRWSIAFLFATVTLTGLDSRAQAPDNFRWIDFHSPKDEDVVVWITRALDGQNWTAMREIGVQYDAALVVTSLRTSSQSAANDLVGCSARDSLKCLCVHERQIGLVWRLHPADFECCFI